MRKSITFAYVHLRENKSNCFRRSLSDETDQTLTLHRYGTNKQCGTRILIVDYACYITITGGSGQHSAVVLFDLYVAASERSHLDAV